MADRYWVGGSGNWSDTNRWSTASGGAGGASVPTSADNVIFDAGSNVGTGTFTVTVDGTLASPSLCADFSTGGAGGALDGAMTLSLGATAYLDIYGSMTLPATNLTWTGTSGAELRFRATTTGKTVTTNGVTINGTAINFDGNGGGWTLGSAYSGAQFRIVQGTFDSGNYNISGSLFSSSYSTTRSVSLGSSTISVSGSQPVLLTTTTNLTWNAGTSTITCSATSPTFDGGGLTFYNVTFSSSSTGTTTISGANTFNNLTQTSRGSNGIRNFTLSANQTVSGTLTLGAANTAIRRIRVFSSAVGTQRTITLNGTLATLADVDFQDIKAAGTVARPWTGTRIGDGLNNSDITFDAAKTVYWNLAGSQNWSATGWATTNNGTPAVNNFPLAQDTAVFTEAGAAGTVTFDSFWWFGSIQMADGVSNRTTAFTLATGGQTLNCYGNITLFSSLTLTGTGTLNFQGYGVTQTITSAGITFTQPITVNAPTGTFKIADNFTQTATGGFTHTAGTVDLNNLTLTCYLWSSSNSNTRSIAFGTGNITVTGNNATVWTTSTATNFTVTGTPVVNFTYSGGTGTRTITMGNLGSLLNEANSISVNISAGTDTVGLGTTSGAYKNINFTGFSGIGAFSNSIAIYGNLTISTGMTVSSGTVNLSFQATSGTQQITSNGKTIDYNINQNNPGATLQLQDNLTLGSTKTFTLNAGTLDLSSGNRTLSTGLFNSNNSNTRAISFGTGNITLTGNNATIWNIGTATGFTTTGTQVVNSNYSGAIGTRTIANTSSITEANQISFNITAGTDTVVATSGFRSLNFTGFAGTLSNGSRNLFGNLIISSGMTVSAGTSATTFAATSGTQQVTTNGLTLDFPITVNAPGATVQLQDALTMGSTRTLTLTAGTLDANNKNVTTGLFSSSNTNVRTLTMGSGTWAITGAGDAWDTSTATNLTLNANTSTISMTSSSAKTFKNAGVATYYTLNQGGTGALTINAGATFYSITNTIQPAFIYFPAGQTVTTTTFLVNGTSGNLMSLRSTTPGSVWNLVQASGAVGITYVDIQDSNASGGASFQCINGVNSGNNTGWTFINSGFSSGNFLIFF